MKSRISSSGDDRDAVAVELAKLLTPFPAPGDDAHTAMKIRMAGFFEALAGIPLWAIVEARGKVMRGETGIDGRFAPTPPLFAAIARAILAPLKSELARLELVEEAIANGERVVCPEERAHINVGFEKLKVEFRPIERTGDQRREVAIGGLQARASASGVDFKTTFDAVSDRKDNK